MSQDDLKKLIAAQDELILQAKRELGGLEFKREAFLEMCRHEETSIDTNNEHGIPVKRCDLCGMEVE